MYSGLQPAITALIATFSAVIETWRFSMNATCSPGSMPPAASIALMRSAVAGTTGRPSVQPLVKHSSIASSGFWTVMGREASGVSIWRWRMADGGWRMAKDDTAVAAFPGVVVMWTKAGADR